MPIEIACPECDHNYLLADSIAGKRFRCKQCEAVVSVPARPAKRAEKPKVTRSGTATRRRRPAGQDTRQAEPRGKAKAKRSRRESGTATQRPKSQRAGTQQPKSKGRSQQQRNKKKDAPFLLDLEVVEEDQDKATDEWFDDGPDNYERPRPRARSKGGKRARKSSDSGQMIGAVVVAVITLGGMAVGAMMMKSSGDEEGEVAVGDAFATESGAIADTNARLAISSPGSPPVPEQRPLVQDISAEARTLALRLTKNVSAMRFAVQSGASASHAGSGADKYNSWVGLLDQLNKIKSDGETVALDLQFKHQVMIRSEPPFTGADELKREIDALWKADLDTIGQVVNSQNGQPWFQLRAWHKQMSRQREVFWELFQ